MRIFRLPIKRAFSALLLGVGGLGAAESPPSLSLQDAIARSLANSPAVLIQHEIVSQRQAQKQQASGEFDTTLSANYLASRTDQPGVQSNAVNFQSYLEAAGVVIPTLATNLNPFDVSNTTVNKNYTYQLSLSQKLRDGIVIAPQATVLATTGISPQVASVATGQLSLSVLVPMLRGLGKDSTGAREAAARGEIDVARLLYNHALAFQALQTALAYWKCRAAQERLAVRRDAESRAGTLLDSTRALVSGRVLPPESLVQTESNLVEKRALRIAAELEASSAQVEFGRTMGLDYPELARIPAPRDEFPRPGPVTGEIGRWCETAFAHRSDCLAAQRSREPLEILARKASRDLLPRLDTEVQVGYATLAPGIDPVSGISNRVTSGNGSVSVTLDWPLQNRLQRGVLNELRSRQRQNESTIAGLKQNIAGEVATSVIETQKGAELVTAGDDSLTLAGRAVDQEREQLRVGEANLLDLINLENQLSAVRLRATDARAAYASAVAQLRFAVGAIFEAPRQDGSFVLADLSTLPKP